MDSAVLDSARSAAAERVGLDPRVLAQVVARVSSVDYDQWDLQVRHTGACANPIRLRGVVTRNGQVVFDTATQPNGVLLTRCKNRRASVCASCSYEYRGDAWQLLFAGIIGGRKGIPESVASHPEVFVTLTAPSFGTVHGTRDGKPCHPGSEGQLCAHGRPRWCRLRHRDGDEHLGEPLCGDCYDYRTQCLFNWWASELWRRLTVALYRRLAARTGLSEKDFKAAVHVEYGKVAEYQRRGAVHFHALIRLDANTGPGGDYAPPPFTITPADITAAVRSAAALVRYHADEGGNRTVALRWGTQTDVKEVNSGISGQLTGEAVAGYISKYQTKSTEDLGLGGRPLTAQAARDLGLSDHVVAIVAACEHLAATVPSLARMRRWTHMLGFRGHCFTKSRRFSTTFGKIRAERADYRRRQDAESRGLDPDDQDETLVVGTWEYAGSGHHTAGDALLATSIAAWTREGRELAREARHTQAA